MEWISVEKEMPVIPEGCSTYRILVNVNGFGVHIDVFVFGKFHKHGEFVTHWMPLPQPPIGE